MIHLISTVILLLLIITPSLYSQIHIHDNGRGIEFPGAIQHNTGFGLNWNMTENGATFNDYFTNSEAIMYGNIFLGAINGDRSSAQSTMVALGDSLYVFYVDDYDQTQQGYYSVVDMTTNTIVRTVNLGSPYSEKITAERHCDPDYYYVLMQRCNSTYEIRQVDSTGVHLHSTYNSGENMELCIGCAKIRDGKLISSNFGTGNGEGNVNIYDFVGGMVGPQIQSYQIDHAYGVELIHPNAYVGQRTFGGTLWHLDYLTGDSTVISNAGGSYQFGQMTRGDSKVYVVRFATGVFREITPPQTVGNWSVGFNSAGLGWSQTFDTCTVPFLLFLDTTKNIYVDRPMKEDKELGRLFTYYGQLLYRGPFDRNKFPDLPIGGYVWINKWDEVRLILIQ